MDYPLNLTRRSALAPQEATNSQQRQCSCSQDPAISNLAVFTAIVRFG